MLMDAFDADLKSRVYRELDSAFDPERPMRLKSRRELADLFSSQRAPLVVAKPLLDSQIASKILDSFDGSRGIWIFRDFRSVAISNLRRFGNGNGFEDLEPILRANVDDWRYEAISNATAQIIRSNVDRGISEIDAAALFWFVRNQSFFDQQLDDRNDILLCQYESLVSDADSEMRRIYKFVGAGYPGPKVVRHIHQAAVGRGAGIRLDDEVEALCNDLNEQLLATARRDRFQ